MSRPGFETGAGFLRAAPVAEPRSWRPAISLQPGEHYAPSAAALVILGWAGALQIVATVLEAFLFSYPTHRVQDYIVGAFMPVLVNALLCVLLIRQYGFVGAAAAAVGGRLVYLIYVAHYCRQRLGSEALRLQHYGDSALLLLSAFGMWYLTFAVIANACACVVAVVFTLPLIAGFVLYVRRRSAARAEPTEPDRQASLKTSLQDVSGVGRCVAGPKPGTSETLGSRENFCIRSRIAP
jgi:hypothetical protein